MLSSSDQYLDSRNPESSPIIDLDSDISTDLLINFEKNSHFPDSTLFDKESQLQLSNLDELFSQSLSQSRIPSAIRKSKKKKVIKSAIFHPFASIENTEITVQSLKSYFK
ncbi:hypothetical protein TVAG_288590 [Trichomonas vaginalis G3]|uniref:Uncharacterized protein n=1 Tax=Trichomonas vaginalis (strain ATCC PRA-98 / G3) TaxID=412133 RepID=A2FEB8_TRIV3|nr:hypothetical protein TVAGG3_0545690 [Trichomonas vaginalis G3]EAX96758.1 hypothetical protein TVAG_288590 [Trichomonas vaginalis G3]KAI5520161.1 hypothetical protein TVAGG3_0545690 [Trichomonas vaginalis G3]|eukprot:XP_001309688.1 hypothetical protein [Trichomonas vaginalis G3]